MTADLACQMSSCLCQDNNILLLFKRDILYTGNVEYILLCLKKKTDIKIKQAFKNIQQPRTSRNISSGKSSSFNGIWRMRNKFPSCCKCNKCIVDPTRNRTSLVITLPENLGKFSRVPSMKVSAPHICFCFVFLNFF